MPLAGQLLHMGAGGLVGRRRPLVEALDQTLVWNLRHLMTVLR